MVIDSTRKDNVILLPKTIDYYQEELTHLLETEKYEEAVQLLNFLLQCRNDDLQTSEEWNALLGWLKSTFTEYSELDVPPEPDSATDDEEEWTETDLHKKRFYTKMSEDPNYVKKLLETILSDPRLDKKMVALEQLVIADHPQINDTLVRWLEQVDLHPFVQFKVLRTLRERQCTGTVNIQRCGEQVDIDIAATPLQIEQYPIGVQRVIHRIQEVSEVHHPNLTYFVEHTWQEFLAYIYGTSVYKPLQQMDEEDIDVWAAALHQAVVETMTGTTDDETINASYNLNAHKHAQMEHAYERIKSFIASVFVT
ncbi:MAG: hypothetical protein WDZ91_05890 [Paenibacillaceae bacterium]